MLNRLLKNNFKLYPSKICHLEIFPNADLTQSINPQIVQF